jgi:SAM-dependent methyltransferase
MRVENSPFSTYISADKELDDLVVKDIIFEILSAYKSHHKCNINNINIIDVGCGKGEVCFGLESNSCLIVGVEPHQASFDIALKKKNEINSNVVFYNSKIEDVNLTEKFDLAISLTTIEHMPVARESIAKVFNLLKPGGVLYLTAPNKLWPMEPHYQLPFLSWLPLPFANRYLKLFRGVSSYEDCSYSKTYWGMKKLFNGYDCKYKFQLPENYDSSYIGLGGASILSVMFRKLGILLISRYPSFWAISKGFIIVAVKN